MTPDLRKLVEELTEFEAKATPGPWERDCQSQYDRNERQHYIEHFVTGHLRDRVCTANHGDAQELIQDDRGTFSDERARADLDFIASFRNAWPQIKSALESLSAEMPEEPFWWWASGSIAKHSPHQDYQVVEKAAYDKLATHCAGLRRDKERLDWFEMRANAGGCPSLIYDDNGNWAVGEDGLQNLRLSDKDNLSINHEVSADNFKPTIREAIDSAMKGGKDG